MDPLMTYTESLRSDSSEEDEEDDEELDFFPSSSFTTGSLEEGRSNREVGRSIRPGFYPTSLPIGKVVSKPSLKRRPRKSIVRSIKDFEWRKFWKGGSVLHLFRWLLCWTTSTPDELMSDEKFQYSISSVARMLILLRDYQARFGMPENTGGPKDQEFVLREVTRDLYLGGTPIWALEPVMTKVAEGLTGKRGVDFLILPRKAFIFAPSSGATTMFRIERGFDIQKMDSMETVAVRLASFASNTHGVTSVPSRWPKPRELRQAFRRESQLALRRPVGSAEDMADTILTLASEAQGLFFYVNCEQDEVDSQHFKTVDAPVQEQQQPGKLRSSLKPRSKVPAVDFWKVEAETRELFSRLATMEAIAAIGMIDAERKVLYSNWVVILFRFGSSAGTCAIWFNGSWLDMLVSGVLAVIVASIGACISLSKQERIIMETVASFFVGFTAGLLSLKWPDHMCFGALALAGVLDLLQGFRVVYAIIELMAKHTVAGGADLLEGVLVNGLIASFLKVGLKGAEGLIDKQDEQVILQCTTGIDKAWYFLFVPVAALSWSGLFDPNYVDLPWMTFHGVLAYLAVWAFGKLLDLDELAYLNSFIAALTVTLSAGIVSLCTGRQALGNTVAGLYVLLPGSYLIDSVFSGDSSDFINGIILPAVVIGIGAWTGTLLVSPTLLGATKNLLNQQESQRGLSDASPTGGNLRVSQLRASTLGGYHEREHIVRKHGTGAMLFF